MAIAGVERRYLTVGNAQKVDAVRHRLRMWRDLLTEVEHSLLMTCLLEAVAEVSNIAGTYGCYLKRWKATALRSVRPPYRDLPNTGRHLVTCRDAELVAAETEAERPARIPPIPSASTPPTTTCSTASPLTRSRHSPAAPACPTGAPSRLTGVSGREPPRPRAAGRQEL